MVKAMWQVEVRGFPFYNPNSSKIESGPHRRVAVTIVDDRSIESLKLLVPENS